MNLTQMLEAEQTFFEGQMKCHMLQFHSFLIIYLIKAEQHSFCMCVTAHTFELYHVTCFTSVASFGRCTNFRLLCIVLEAVKAPD